MVEKTVETRSEQRLSDPLERSGRLSVADAARFLKSLCERIVQLHKSGKVYLGVCAENIWIDVRFLTRLHGLDPVLDIGKSDGPSVLLPPELDGLREVELVEEIEASRKTLQHAGYTIDPRRIDTFQLGCITCRVLTGHSPDDYLYSPQVKGQVPPAWQSLIDRALGYDAANRLETCEQCTSCSVGSCRFRPTVPRR